MTTATAPMGAPQTPLEWALHYLQANAWSIFPVCSPSMPAHRHRDASGLHKPCDKPGKTPLVRWGKYQVGLPLEAEIRGWWRKWPEANIGMATGALSGVVVVDLDGDLAQQDADNRGYTAGPWVNTGRPGGKHAYFAYRDDAPRNFVKVGGIDYRGGGGYVVLPPSRHHSGVVYTWGLRPLPDQAYPVPPRWVDELAKQRNDKAGSNAEYTAIDVESRIEHGFPDGVRDDGIHAVASKLRGEDRPIEEAYEICRQIAEACDPPFDNWQAKVDGAYQRYEPNPPPIRIKLSGSKHKPEDADDDQAEPVALRAPIPIFPSQSLPLELRNYCSFSSLPIAALASAGLSALAVAIGGEAELSVTSETTVRAIVWNVPIGLPSAGKSPAGMKLFQPLRERDAIEATNYNDELRAWNAAEEEDRGRAPVEKILVHGSMTVEALFDVLGDTPCILQAFDELSHFLNDLGRYSKGNNSAVGSDSGDAAMYLEGWTGAPMRRRVIGQRVRGKAGVRLYCARPTISLWGPLTLANQGLLGGEGSGFRCRWLPYLVQARTDVPAGKIFDPGDVGHPEYTTAWAKLIDRLLERRSTRRQWYLPEASRRRVEEHRVRWKQRAESIESTTTVTAALGKADVAMESIALILAEAELVSLPGRDGRHIAMMPPLRLSVEVVDRAAAWVDYCIDTWAVLGDAEIVSFTNVDRLADPVVTRVEEWIAQHGQVNDPVNPWVWENDLFIHKVAGVRERRDWKPVLVRYQGRNPGHIVSVDTPGKPGPKPRRVYAPRYRPTVPENGGSSFPEKADFESSFGKGDPPEPKDDPPEPNSEPPEINSEPPVAAPSEPVVQSRNGHDPAIEDVGVEV